jgi:hypothetical protein
MVHGSRFTVHFLEVHGSRFTVHGLEVGRARVERLRGAGFTVVENRPYG